MVDIFVGDVLWGESLFGKRILMDLLSKYCVLYRYLRV